MVSCEEAKLMTKQAHERLSELAKTHLISILNAVEDRIINQAYKGKSTCEFSLFTRDLAPEVAEYLRIYFKNEIEKAGFSVHIKESDGNCFQISWKE